jgi:hypothetical protein
MQFAQSEALGDDPGYSENDDCLTDEMMAWCFPRLGEMVPKGVACFQACAHSGIYIVLPSAVQLVMVPRVTDNGMGASALNTEVSIYYTDLV